jgi:hypothetical protein
MIEKLHNKEFNNFCSSVSVWVIKSRQVRQMKWAVHIRKCEMHVNIKAGKYERKIQHERPWHRRDDNINLIRNEPRTIRRQNWDGFVKPLELYMLEHKELDSQY